jgi:hypothetical protein
MIALRQASSVDNFVIVCHGLHDAKDFGWGLAIPLANGGSVMKTSYEVLKPLIELRDSGADPDEFEKNYTYTNAGLNLTNVHHSRGSVKRLVNKMRGLQQLKVRIVELRACTLGTNVPGLEIVGRSFGARFIVAPKVHMFYVNTGVAMGFNTAPHYDQQLPRIPRARKFANTANGAERLAIEVQKGNGFNFSTRSLTDTVNLKWFTDTKLWPANSYANGRQRPRDFFMEGMDLGPGNYALPSEQTYCDQLVEAGPLAGNLI